MKTLLVLLALAAPLVAAESAAPKIIPVAHNTPSTLLANPRVRTTFGPERLVIPDGLQPSLLFTRAGTLVVQGQLSSPSLPSTRYVSHWLMGTAISRDADAATWTPFLPAPGHNGVNLEGGALQLRDGSILALDTYVTPGKKPGTGEGQLYTSADDWRTLQGPFPITFDLPGVNFRGSSDDGGHPH
ncbi:MAG: exo-alpha-sialidase, partial [Undibacterium sp.]|nr:exo-alpha-sialidase [Opitutaceae bacterium]